MKWLQVPRKISLTVKEFILFEKRFTVRRELHQLLDDLKDCHDFEKRIDWVIYFCAWLRLPHNLEVDTQIEGPRIPAVRFKYVLHLLEKSPDLKVRFFYVITQTLVDMSDIDFFSEVGLSNQVGFIQELSERITVKALPSTPLKHDLSTLIYKLFPDQGDLVWIDRFDDDVLARLIDECLANTEIPLTKIVDDLVDALIFLGSQVQSLTLSSQFRERLQHRRLSELPFYNFSLLLHEYAQARRSQDWAHLQNLKVLIVRDLELCHEAMHELHSHLDEYGVSLSMVFQMQRLQRQLGRISIIVETLSQPKLSPAILKEFLLQLVHDVQAKKGLRIFLKNTLHLLTLKVVERNSEIGEHYISHGRRELISMFKKACGGGLITAFTLFIKFGIMALGLPAFQTGFLAGLNYAVSFLGIQLSGFTLATKQPASTAPAIATKLRDFAANRLEPVTDEIIALLRSQLIGVVGNLIVVAPVALIIYYFYQGVFGHPAISPEKAEHILESTYLTGPSCVYATFTGFLLFASSLCAGWFDNWVTFRKIKERIRYNEKIRNVFGRRNARFAGQFIQTNAAPLAANISLGFMLGMGPEILHFLGLPLDVRHVTLSTGSLAAALPVLGYGTLLTWPFWNAFLGILLIGTLNLAVSFGLAFSLALNAQKVRKQQRRALMASLVQRILKHPIALFIAHHRPMKNP
jgi:site-specific recombinase